MTTRVHLHVVVDDVRGDDVEAPVHVGRDGKRVVVILDTEHADRLARILALFDTLVDGRDLAFEFDGDVWHHTMLDLLRQSVLGNDPAATAAANTIAATMWPRLEVVR